MSRAATSIRRCSRIRISTGAKLFDPAKPLPYPDASFDLIYSSWVLEHVDDPATVAGELMRVLKPGGCICAVTPNKRGYISMAARLAGNARHVPLLKRIQPDRLDHDVFPTGYKLNTPAAIRRYFGDKGDVVVYAMSSEPSYYFGNSMMFRIFKLIHKLTPSGLHTALFVLHPEEAGMSGTRRRRKPMPPEGMYDVDQRDPRRCPRAAAARRRWPSRVSAAARAGMGGDGCTGAIRRRRGPMPTPTARPTMR